MSGASGQARMTAGCACADGRAGRAAAPVLDSEFVAAATGGRWVRRAATERAGGFSGVGIDSREMRPGSLFIAVRGERHDGHDHVGAAAAGGAGAAMVSREVDLDALPQSLDVLRVDDTVLAMQRLAAAWRRALGCVVVGITGSAGKTTTRRLVHAAIAGTIPAVQSPKSFNNHLGVPLTLLSAGHLAGHSAGLAGDPTRQVVVAEIGMNAPGEIAVLTEIAAPEIGVITTVGRAHLEGVGSLAGVAREKSDLLRRVRAGACAPLALAPCGIEVLEPYLCGVPGLLRFGESEQAHVRLIERRPLADGQEIRVRCAEPGRVPEELRVRLRLPGRHNALNALIAVAVARHLAAEMADRLPGVPDSASIAEALSTVVPEAMRFQPVPVVLETGPGADAGGPPVWLINDAYNANPESMAAALATFAEVCGGAPRRVLVLGDMLELGADAQSLHAELAKRIADTHRAAPLAAVVLVGPLMACAAEELRRARDLSGVEIVHHAGLDAPRAESIAGMLRPGDAVLLKGSRGMAIERVAAALGPRVGGAAVAAG